MSESVAPPATGTAEAAPAPRSRGTRVLVILARITAGLIVVQFALAGLGAFSMIHGTGVDRAYAAHSGLGYLIAALTLVLLIVAVIVRPNRATVLISVALFLLAAPVQPALAQLGHDHSAWIGLLHALNGVAIGALTGVLASGAAGRRG